MQKHLLSDNFLHVIKQIIIKIQNSDLSPFVKEVILYGSCARGEQNSKSDIDILIVLTGKENIETDRLRQFKAESMFVGFQYPETDLHFTFNENWRNDSGLYFQNVRKDGIALWTQSHT